MLRLHTRRGERSSRIARGLPRFLALLLDRDALAVDLAFVHDAVLDAGSRSLSLTWRRAQTAHMDWGLSAGLVDSATFGNIGFLGAQIGLAN